MATICKFAKQIREHFVKNEGKGDLNQLLKQAGANDLEAKDITRIMENRFKAVSKEDANALMAKLLKDPEIKQNSSKFQKLIEDTIVNKARPEQLRTQIAESLNLPTLKPEKAKKIAKLAEEVQNLKRLEPLNLNKIREKTAFLEREIAESVPSKFLEKADTYTVANLLLSPKTIARNVLSNEFELLGKQFETIFKGRWKANDAKLLNDIRFKTFKQVNDDIAKGIRTTNLAGSELYGAGIARKFRPDEAKNIWAKSFETVGAFQEKGLRYALEAHDVVVRRMSYAQSIIDQLRSNKNLKGIEFKTQSEFDTFLKKLDNGEVKGISKTEWDDIKAYSEWDAAHTVLQDDSAVARLASDLSQAKGIKDPVLKGAAKFFLGTAMKFAKTPSNVVIRALEKDVLTGTGISLMRYLSGSKKGLTKEFLQKQLIAGVVRGLANTVGIGGAGYILSAYGFIAPEGYKDTQVIKIGDLTFNIAPFAIFAPALALGAEIQQNIEEANKENKSKIKAVLDAYGDNIINLGKAMLDMPLSAGLKKIVETAEAMGEPEVLKEKLAEFFVSGGTQWVPFVSLLRGVAKTIDPMERETYDKDTFKKSLNYAISNIPGLRQTLQEKIDTAGMPVKPVFSSPVVRMIDAIFNPALANKSPEKDPVFAELRKLSREEVRKKGQFDYAPGTIRAKKQKFELTNEEKRRFQKTYGNFAYNEVKRVINSDIYRNADPDIKQEIIHRIELRAKKIAKDELLRLKRN